MEMQLPKKKHFKMLQKDPKLWKGPRSPTTKDHTYFVVQALFRFYLYSHTSPQASPQAPFCISNTVHTPYWHISSYLLSNVQSLLCSSCRDSYPLDPLKPAASLTWYLCVIKTGAHYLGNEVRQHDLRSVKISLWTIYQVTSMYV